MPIYEFYCPGCHTIYSFWSKTVDTRKRPLCPGCGSDTLQRRISPFAVISSAQGDALGGPPIDEARMESAISSLASEAEGVDGEDPRAAARLMRRLSDMAGLEYGKGMEEALKRLEAGEDPEAVEADLGDIIDGEEEPFVLPDRPAGRRRTRRPPGRDDTLYEM